MYVASSTRKYLLKEEMKEIGFFDIFWKLYLYVDPGCLPQRRRDTEEKRH
jgi:hypothetical protein